MTYDSRMAAMIGLADERLPAHCRFTRSRRVTYSTISTFTLDGHQVSLEEAIASSRERALAKIDSTDGTPVASVHLRASEIHQYAEKHDLPHDDDVTDVVVAGYVEMTAPQPAAAPIGPDDAQRMLDLVLTITTQRDATLPADGADADAAMRDVYAEAIEALLAEKARPVIDEPPRDQVVQDGTGYMWVWHPDVGAWCRIGPYVSPLDWDSLVQRYGVRRFLVPHEVPS